MSLEAIDGVLYLNGEATTVDDARVQAWLANDPEHQASIEKQQADADRLAILAEPITPLPIEGTTVAEVKASAEASIADLAVQMEAKIQALSEQ
jgi:ferric-dicitrate binding protein FerR (iron transport regulator)